MNLVQAEWETALLGDVCENLDKSRVPITKSKRVSGKTPYYGASGIVDYVKDFIFDEELLLVSEDGANLLARTYPIAFSITGKTWVNNHAHVLRFESEDSQKFIEYYLNSISLEPYVSGMAQPKLNQKSLNNIPVPLPPLPEQKRIVAILDEAFAGISQAATNAEKNLANARELFDSYLNNVFTQKGDGWAETTLDDLGKITSSKRIYKREYTSSGIPFYRTKEVKEKANGRDITTELFISEDRYAEIKDKFGVPQKGDILLTAIGTIGEIFVVDGCEDFYFKDGNVLWLKDFKTVNPYFLRYVLMSFVESLKRLSHGAAYNALPIEKLKNHIVYLPSADEQKDVVSKLDTLQVETNTLEVVYQKKLTALTEFKQSILQKAFQGELLSESMEKVANG